MKYLKRFESLNDVKFCHNCGVELESSNKFCNECGEKQEESNTGSSNTLIKSLIMAKDGGTLNIDSNIGNFTVDKKIGTKTPYKITKPSRIKGNPNHDTFQFMARIGFSLNSARYFDQKQQIEENILKNL